jgi:hypothetical protein
MYELKKIGKIFTSKFVGTGPLPYKKNYWDAVSQRLRNTVLDPQGCVNLESKHACILTRIRIKFRTC